MQSKAGRAAAVLEGSATVAQHVGTAGGAGRQWLEMGWEHMVLSCVQVAANGRVAALGVEGNVASSAHGHHVPTTPWPKVSGC